MQPIPTDEIPTDEIPTDDEIRASPAFPRLVRAFRLEIRIFWMTVPSLVAVIVWLAEGGGWAAFATGGLISVASTCGRVYAIRSERQPLAEISGSPVAPAVATHHPHRTTRPLTPVRDRPLLSIPTPARGRSRVVWPLFSTVFMMLLTGQSTYVVR